MNDMRKLMEAADEGYEYITKQVVGHEDRESHMMQRELLKIRDYASDLVDMLDDLPDGDFPHWWQSKLVKAGDYISTIKHFLEGEMELAARAKEKGNVEPVELDAYAADISDELDMIDPYSVYEVSEDDDWDSDWQEHTQRGNLEDQYQNYLDFADDGNGMDITTGEPLKSFDEWLNS